MAGDSDDITRLEKINARLMHMGANLDGTDSRFLLTQLYACCAELAIERRNHRACLVENAKMRDDFDVLRERERGVDG